MGAGPSLRSCEQCYAAVCGRSVMSPALPELSPLSQRLGVGPGNLHFLETSRGLHAHETLGAAGQAAGMGTPPLASCPGLWP